MLETMLWGKPYLTHMFLDFKVSLIMYNNWKNRELIQFLLETEKQAPEWNAYRQVYKSQT